MSGWLGPLLVAIHVAGLVFTLRAARNAHTAQGAVAWAIGLILLPWVALPAYLFIGPPRPGALEDDQATLRARAYAGLFPGSIPVEALASVPPRWRGAGAFRADAGDGVPAATPPDRRRGGVRRRARPRRGGAEPYRGAVLHLPRRRPRAAGPRGTGAGAHGKASACASFTTGSALAACRRLTGRVCARQDATCSSSTSGAVCRRCCGSTIATTASWSPPMGAPRSSAAPTSATSISASTRRSEPGVTRRSKSPALPRGSRRHRSTSTGFGPEARSTGSGPSGPASTPPRRRPPSSRCCFCRPGRRTSCRCARWH